MRSGRKSSWEGGKWSVAQEKEGKSAGKNRDKKLVMVKLIMQNPPPLNKTTTKYTRCRNNKNSVFW
jgi:hypothetical protein